MIDSIILINRFLSNLFGLGANFRDKYSTMSANRKDYFLPKFGNILSLCSHCWVSITCATRLGL